MCPGDSLRLAGLTAMQCGCKQNLTKRLAMQGLQDILEDEDIPKEWGGSREKPFYNNKHEEELFKIVAKNNGDKVSDYAIDGLFEPPAEGSSSNSK
jgi:hypothetical protein